jgi:hypothetical protein
MSRAQTLVKRIEPAVYEEPWLDEEALFDDEPVRGSGVLLAAPVSMPIDPAESTPEVAAASWAMTVRALLLDMEALRSAIDEAIAQGDAGFVTDYAQRVAPAAESCATAIEALAERLMRDGQLADMNLDSPIARLLRAASDWLERIVRELIHLLDDLARGHDDGPTAVEHVGMFSAFDMRMCLLPALTDARLSGPANLDGNAFLAALASTIDDLEERVVQLNWLLRVSG